MKNDAADEEREWLGGANLDEPRRERLASVDRRGRHRCPLCRGEGRIPGVTKARGKGTGMGSDYGPCPECGGSGWTSDDDEEPDPKAPGDIAGR